MESKIIRIGSVILFVSTIQYISAQCIIFNYDAAGDRTARNICPQALQASSDPALAKSDVFAHVISNENDILVFPNPTSGFLEIRSDHFYIESNVLITDILGRKFYSGKLSSSRIDMSRFQMGRYYLRITDSERVRVVGVLKIDN